MGHGLALLAAKSGHEVILIDVDREALERAMGLIRAQLGWLEGEGEIPCGAVAGIMERIRPLMDSRADLPHCDLVIEAISEDPTMKAELYGQIAPLLAPNAVVASNTSYLNVFSFAPEEILSHLAIAHFYAPPYLIPLVEVVGGEETPRESLAWLVEVLRGMGQRPVDMEQFIPGYIVNRLQRAMAREIFHLLDEGYASPEVIDEAVQASLGIRLPVLGVVRRYDFTGLDLALKFLSNPSIQLVNEDRIPRVLKTRVEAGELGVKTGRGFYDYSRDVLPDVLRDRDRRLLALRRFLQENKIPMTSSREE
jgi:3-hydroxybutyryl-CoA dehydrogenase